MFIVFARSLRAGRPPASTQPALQSGRAAGERVSKSWTSRSRSMREQAIQLHPSKGEVEYRHVSFGYTEERQILKDINLHAQAGEMIALVGTTGAGKSTVINLLTRFYEYGDGDILIDGGPSGTFHAMTSARASRWSPGELSLQRHHRRKPPHGQTRRPPRRKCGRPSRPQTPPSSSAACRKGCIPLSASVGISSAWAKSSASHRRALLKNPPISHPRRGDRQRRHGNERLIQEALDRLMTNRTSFVIAHRLSTVRPPCRPDSRPRPAADCRTRQTRRPDRAGGIYAKLSRLMEDDASLNEAMRPD